MSHKFVKVGDVVKLKAGTRVWDKLSYDGRYMVMKTEPNPGYDDDDTFFITKLEDGRSNIINLKINERYFDIVWEDKAHTMKNRFAVGDRVISIKNTPEVPEGFIGHITATNGDVWSYTVDDGKGKSECFNEDELELLSVAPAKKEVELPVKPTVYDMPKPDVINSPKHYAVFESVEAIQVIASSMTQDQFYGYCLGNCLKYRLRAGAKDDVMQELAKANKYQELYTEHKHLCKEGK